MVSDLYKPIKEVRFQKRQSGSLYKLPSTIRYIHFTVKRSEKSAEASEVRNHSSVLEGKNCTKKIYCDGGISVSIIMSYPVSILVRETLLNGFSCN